MCRFYLKTRLKCVIILSAKGLNLAYAERKALQRLILLNHYLKFVLTEPYFNRSSGEVKPSFPKASILISRRPGSLQSGSSALSWD